MTMRIQLAAAVAALALLLLSSPASAHGATPPRAIDVRILQDDDGSLSPGACVEGQCPPVGSTGLDLLTLDAREASLADGTPIIVLRLSYQTPATSLDGQAIEIAFKTPAGDKTVTFTGAGQAFTGPGCVKVSPPEAVGDGTPKAVGCTLSALALGVKTGDELTEIQVASSNGDGAFDVMPGTWYLNGELAPHVPTVPEPGEVPNPEEVMESVEEPELGVYKVTGPAKLMNLTSTPAPTQGPFTATLSLQSAVPLDQFATATISHEGNFTASLSQTAIQLKAGATAKISILTITNVKSSGMAMVTVTSDLGAYEVIHFQVKAPPPPPAANSTTSAPTTSSSKASPGPALVPVTLALAAHLSRRKGK